MCRHLNPWRFLLNYAGVTASAVAGRSGGAFVATSRRKQISPRCSKKGNSLVRPDLILRRQSRHTLFVITNSAPVSAIEVNLLKCTLEVEYCVGILFG
jgi:hypothetical protein